MASNLTSSSCGGSDGSSSDRGASGRRWSGSCPFRRLAGSLQKSTPAEGSAAQSLVGKQAFPQERPTAAGGNGGTPEKFSVPEQLKESFEQMNALRADERLCDVCLNVSGTQFHCHRVVLAASCPYFHAMFSGQMVEAHKPVIEIPNIHAAVMRRVLDFAYTGEVTLTECSVCHVFVAAAMLGMQRLVDACATYMARKLDPGNCIGIRRFAKEYGCEALHREAECFLLRRFCEVRLEDEFKTMTACELYGIISSECLAVRCEKEVYSAVIDWVAHDVENRQSVLKRLLCRVRLCAMPPQFLSEQLARCDTLRRNDDCAAFLTKVLDEMTIHKPDMSADARPRPPGDALVIYCVGGYQRCSLSCVDFYCVRMKIWHRATDMPRPRSGLAACVIQGVLYAVGGRNNSAMAACEGGNGDLDCSAVDAFEPSTNTWHPLPPMLTARNRVGVGVLDGLLYAVGGSCGPQSYASVERYNPQTRQWTMMASMSCARNAVGVAVVNRFLYAVGGFDGQTRFNTIECFHPEKGEWMECPPMSTPRSGAGVCALNDYIYVAGGYDSAEQLSSVERYDTRTKTWQLVCPMKRARSALSMVSLNGKLYALGGYGDNEFMSSVECYTPETDSWCEETAMPCGRSGQGVAVTMLPSMCS